MANNDLFKRYIDQGMLITNVLGAAAGGAVKELLKSGAGPKDPTMARAEQLLERSRRSTEELVKFVRSEIAAQISDLAIVTKADLADFELRLKGELAQSWAARSRQEHSVSEPARPAPPTWAQAPTPAPAPAPNLTARPEAKVAPITVIGGHQRASGAGGGPGIGPSDASSSPAGETLPGARRPPSAAAEQARPTPVAHPGQAATTQPAQAGRAARSSSAAAKRVRPASAVAGPEQSPPVRKPPRATSGRKSNPQAGPAKSDPPGPEV
jgi:hypothetical protein